MKRLKKVLAILCCAIILSMSLAVAVYATADSPYSSYSVSISNGWFGGDDTATATISKCACNPVKNWLAACIRVQYQVDGSYYWLPEADNTYYYTHGYNMEEATVTYSHQNIKYAEGYFEAKCGDGSMQAFRSSAYNN